MILYFSATGNSRHAALELARRIDDSRVADMRQWWRRGPVTPIAIGAGERIGFVFPVHSWGLPKGLDRLILSLRFEGVGGGAYCYMACTCGDDCGLAARQWAAVMAAAGLPHSAAYSVFMPNTYVLLPGFDVDSAATAAAKLEAAPHALDAIAQSIRQGKEGDFTHRGRAAWLKSRVIYPLFMRLVSARQFRAGAACTGCGACVAACPTGNVALGSDRRPRWDADCLNCLACYHRCPARCVAYGRRTRGKGHYFFRPSYASSKSVD